MNTDRPVTIEEVTASAEVQIRAATHDRKAAVNCIIWTEKRLAAYERYIRMLKKELKRRPALSYQREDE